MDITKRRNLRAVLLALVMLGALVSDGAQLLPAPREAHAQFIADKPFRGSRRNIELGYPAARLGLNIGF